MSTFPEDNLSDPVHKTLEAMDFAVLGSAQEKRHREEMRSLLAGLIEIGDAAQAFTQHLREQAAAVSVDLPVGTSHVLEKKISQLLAAVGVEMVPAVGSEADLSVHEIVGTQCNASFADRMILAEIMPGYSWRGRLLRASKVVVNQLT